MKRILIIGATSAIAEATARVFAQRRNALYLVGRRIDAVDSIAADLRIRGACQVATEAMDANDLQAHGDMLHRADHTLQGIDVVLIAHGTLGDQKAGELSAEYAVSELYNNGISTVALLTNIAPLFERRRRGTIAVISSIAGERGMQSNYVYGSAKALVSTFLSGLRQRLSKCGVTVLTAKPGWVDTAMQRDKARNRLWAPPHEVAVAIVRAIDRAASVVYVPAYWRLVMLLIRGIPESLFQTLKL